MALPTTPELIAALQTVIDKRTNLSDKDTDQTEAKNEFNAAQVAFKDMVMALWEADGKPSEYTAAFPTLNVVARVEGGRFQVLTFDSNVFE